MKIILIVIVAMLFFFNSHCYSQVPTRIDTLVNLVLYSKENDTTLVYSELCNQGKDAFDAIIGAMDTKDIGVVAQGNIEPYSAATHRMLGKNYMGIHFAYLIELILSDTVCDPFKYDKPPIYKYCVIAKKHECGAIYDALHEEDMGIVQSIYMEWWRDNKHKTIHELKQEWQKGKRPLANNLHYTWL